MTWFLNVLGVLVSKLLNAAEAKEEGEVYHELLPVEKKLVAYSLILAVILLVILVYVSYTYFGVPH